MHHHNFITSNFFSIVFTSSTRMSSSSSSHPGKHIINIKTTSLPPPSLLIRSYHYSNDHEYTCPSHGDICGAWIDTLHWVPMDQQPLLFAWIRGERDRRSHHKIGITIKLNWILLDPILQGIYMHLKLRCALTRPYLWQVPYPGNVYF